MKKFILALLAALLVVSMFTVALADGEEETAKSEYVVVTPAPTDTPAPTEDPTPGTIVITFPDGTTTEVPEGSFLVEVTPTPAPATPTPTPTVAPTATPVAPTQEPAATYVPYWPYGEVDFDGDELTSMANTAAECAANGHRAWDAKKEKWVSLLAEKQVFKDGDKSICESRIAVVRFCTNPYCTYEVTLETKAPLGHELDLKTTRPNPTTGKVEVQCTRCGKWVEQTGNGTGEIKANGDWSDWTVVTPATCVTTGVKKRVNEENGKIEVALIDMLPEHTFDLKAASTYVTKRADCIDDGETDPSADGCYSAVCLTCGATYEWNPAAGCGLCVKKGFVKEFSIEYDDKTTKTIIPDYDNTSKDKPHGTKVLRIKPRVHDWTLGVVTKEPTCLKDGEAKFACKHTDQTNIYNPCFDTLVRVLDHNETVFDARVNATTKRYHDLVEVVEKKPTATEFGIHYYYCKTAGCGYKTNELTYTTSTVTYNGQYDSTKAKGGTGTAAATTTKPTTGTKTTSSSTNKKGVSIPKTNDTTSNLPYVLIAVAFVGLVALVASKKKVNG